MRSLHALLGLLAKRSMLNQQALVIAPRRARSLALRDLLLCALAISAMSVSNSVDGGLLDTAATLIVAVFVGQVSFGTLMRMLSYRAGWLDGRIAMISSLAEAQRRGIDAETWFELELARDLSIMGVESQRQQRSGGSHDDL